MNLDHESSQAKIFDDVIEMMMEAGLFKYSSLRVTDNADNGTRLDVVYHSLLKSPTFQNTFSQPRASKSNDVAVEYRMAGNEKYRKKENVEALKYYTKSINFAENGSSHLGLAYANRSAVLFENKYYKECLQDIERALGTEYPEQLKPKILRRQQDAERLKPAQKPLVYYHKVPCITNKNPVIEAASDAVEIQTNEWFGRHIVATKDIKIGELIVVEKPYVSVVFPKEKWLYCHECMDLCYNMIPCKECTTALYCSENCRMKAFSTYHKYECSFVEYFQEHPFLFSKMVIVGLQDSFINNKADDNIYRSNRFKEMKALTTNEDKRDATNVLLSAAVACFSFHCLKNTKDVYLDFDLKNNELLLRDLLFKCAMIENCNSIGIGSSNVNGEAGEAIYSFSSLFNHSCTPNCDTYFQGSNIVIRANSNIKKGSQCMLCYGPSYYYQDFETRKKILNHFFVRCYCRACVNKWPTHNHLPLGKKIPNSFSQKLRMIADFGLNKRRLNSLLTEAFDVYNSLKPDEPCQSMFFLQKSMTSVYHRMANKIVDF